MGTIFRHSPGQVTSTVLNLNRVLICSTDPNDPGTYSTCSLLTANNCTLYEGDRYVTGFKERIALADLSPTRAVLCNGGAGIVSSCNVLMTIGNSLSFGSKMHFEHMDIVDIALTKLDTDEAAVCFITVGSPDNDVEATSALRCAKIKSESFGLTYGTELVLWQDSSQPPTSVKLVQLDSDKAMCCFSWSLLGVGCTVLQGSGMTVGRSSMLEVSKEPVSHLAITAVDVNEAVLCYVTGTTSSSIHCVTLETPSIGITLRKYAIQVAASSSSLNAFESLALATADRHEVVMCWVENNPTVKRVCKKLTVMTRGTFQSGPEVASFTSQAAILDLARLGTQRTAVCSKVPSDFTNCSVLYNLPAGSSIGIGGGYRLPRQAKSHGGVPWWVAVLCVCGALVLLVVTGIGLCFLCDTPGVADKAKDIIKKKKKKKKGSKVGGAEYEAVDMQDSQPHGPPTSRPPPEQTNADSSQQPPKWAFWKKWMKSSEPEPSVPASSAEDFPTGYH